MEVIERPTLAQVFRRFYPRYRQCSKVTAEQRRAAWCIQACRTPALGEDEWECERCGKVHTVYHNRKLLYQELIAQSEAIEG